MTGSLRRSPRRAPKRWWILLWVVLATANVVNAHPLDPALLVLRETPEAIEVTWRVPSSRPRRAPLAPVLPPDCQATTAAERHDAGSWVTLRWSMRCERAGLSGAWLAIEGLDQRGTDALIRVHLDDGRVVQAVLRPGAARWQVPAVDGRWSVVLGYGRLGWEHILGGWDHLAFVLGLLCLAGGWRGVVATVTAFTVGHSVTLSWAALGWVGAPSAVVEVLIAASIWWVAVALATSRRRGRIGIAAASAFGLLHGLGFAGALAETGLPKGEIPLALLAFNLGIELGQLAFVAAVVVVATVAARVVRAVRRQDASAPTSWPNPRLATATAYVIGTMASYWLVERMVGWWTG